jgi:hypothetical protein
MRWIGQSSMVEPADGEAEEAVAGCATSWTRASHVPYRRYAFHNVYNYAVMGGLASAALLTQNGWLGIVGIGLEALWMALGPESRLLRHAWFDRVHAEVVHNRESLERERVLASLGPDEAARVRRLEALRQEILALCEENQSLALDLLRDELSKLEMLVQAYVELIASSHKNERYLASVDLDELEMQLRRHRAIAGQPGDEDRKRLAEKNLTVLEKRQEKLSELRRFVARTRAQLDLIENTFRLLGDQIVSMRSPRELGGELDELIESVEAVRDTAREAQALCENELWG